MELTGKNWIGGEWVTGGGDAFAAVNPANGETLAPDYRSASVDQVAAACVAAAEAAPVLARLTGAERAAFLERCADEIEALGDPLLERTHLETALPMARLTMERGRTVGQLRLFASVVREGSWVDATWDRAQPDRAPIPKPDLRRMLVPVGPVAVFGASNFPFAFSTAGGDTASALAAGCPVVVKAHPAHPGAGEAVAGAIGRAVAAQGLPAGTFQLVHGPEPAVGRALVEHPAIRAVGFTGSIAGGRALCDAAARRAEPIPVFAEMGSINPIFALPDAVATRGEALAENLGASVFLGVGQFCTSPGVVVLRAGADTDAFLATLERALLAPAGTMLHGGIASSYRAGLDTWSGRSGVAVHRDGADHGDSATVSGAFVVTTAARFVEDPALREECFGPVTMAVVCDSDDDLKAVARALPGQLTATIHAESGDQALAADLAHTLADRAGRLLWNGVPTGVEVCPSMHHGGPWPASSDAKTTSVGTAAIRRFARPVCFQGWPTEMLPDALRDDNPLGILRCVDGEWGRE